MCIATTAAGNVPLNNQLADYTSIAAEARQAFEADWNRLNLILIDLL
ncbi:hypothetical protein KFU94_52765 [Chloroflexi bacterium TSY]|nr:hypothetical protein [Chloroflexi bacterium TSY]